MRKDYGDDVQLRTTWDNLRVRELDEEGHDVHPGTVAAVLLLLLTIVGHLMSSSLPANLKRLTHSSNILKTIFLYLSHPSQSNLLFGIEHRLHPNAILRIWFEEVDKGEAILDVRSHVLHSEVEPLTMSACEQVRSQPQLVIVVRDSRCLRQIAALEPTFEYQTVLLDVLWDGTPVRLLLLHEVLLKDGTCEEVAVGLEVVVVDDHPILLANRLDVGLLPRGIVEHLHLLKLKIENPIEIEN